MWSLVQENTGFPFYCNILFSYFEHLWSGMTFNHCDGSDLFLQKMVRGTWMVVNLHLHILGLVQSLYVEAVILLHQELEMAVFVCGLLEVRLKIYSLYLTFHW